MVEAEEVNPDTIAHILELTNGKQVEEIDAIHSDHKHVGLNMLSHGQMVRASEKMFVIKDPSLGWIVMGPGGFHRNFVEVLESSENPAEENSGITTDPFEGMTRFGQGPNETDQGS